MELDAAMTQADISVLGPDAVDAIVGQEIRTMGSFVDAARDPGMADVSYPEYRRGLSDVDATVRDIEGQARQ